MRQRKAGSVVGNAWVKLGKYKWLMLAIGLPMWATTLLIEPDTWWSAAISIIGCIPCCLSSFYLFGLLPLNGNEKDKGHD
jgi:hypothetical protein